MEFSEINAQTSNYCVCSPDSSDRLLFQLGALFVLSFCVLCEVHVQWLVMLMLIRFIYYFKMFGQRLGEEVKTKMRVCIEMTTTTITTYVQNTVVGRRNNQQIKQGAMVAIHNANNNSCSIDAGDSVDNYSRCHCW